ncbi:putative CDP-diacylglycerol--inositol 3-phosphatidyltransferase [Blattamonas nauphoetae]|uniref:CDP-diacylglycerol--inositol 3-phosphatidyltransferase n=1 Tax=Blattamonas nauphoetae TaxID=2049346 RepID=A0ABQ9YMM2_9EUKA|nr:putative CDP-diacylglycerol--inositol 3-phosphatidyltransferase [Blattamonas nauphoetae]
MARNPIFLYIPNLIGYARIALTIVTFLFYSSPVKFFSCYVLALLGDAFDGLAARKFNQSTKFGALLDMFTDRGSIVSMFCVLSALYPSLSGLFMALAFLDVASHFVRMYTSFFLGFKSHKDANTKKSSPLLRSYYQNRFVLVLIIAGHDGLWLLLYVLYYVDFLPERLSKAFSSLLYSITPENVRVFSLISKNYQFFGHMYDINIPYLTIPTTIVFGICLILATLKVYIHILQLLNGMRDIADKELEDMEPPRKKKVNQ